MVYTIGNTVNLLSLTFKMQATFSKFDIVSLLLNSQEIEARIKKRRCVYLDGPLGVTVHAKWHSVFRWRA